MSQRKSYSQALFQATHALVEESANWHYLDDMTRLVESAPHISHPNTLLMGVEEKSEESEEPEVAAPPSWEDIVEGIFEVSAEEEGDCLGCGVPLVLEVDESRGSMVCSNCGLVVQNQEEDVAETQTYGEDGPEGISRYGCSSDFFSKSRDGTIMQGVGERMKHMQVWGCNNHKDRSLDKDRKWISDICEANGVPGVISDEAQAIFKVLCECRYTSGPKKGKYITIRGGNRRKIIAACLYYACKMNKQPRNFKEIATYFGMEEGDVTKGRSRFEKKVNRHGCRLQMFEHYEETNSVEDMIRRHSMNLNLDQAVEETAVQIAYNAARLKIGTDHNPQSMAAGILATTVDYYDIELERGAISTLFNISEVTINKIVGKIRPYLDTEEAILDEDIIRHLESVFPYGPRELEGL